MGERGEIAELLQEGGREKTMNVVVVESASREVCLLLENLHMKTLLVDGQAKNIEKELPLWPKRVWRI